VHYIDKIVAFIIANKTACAVVAAWVFSNFVSALPAAKETDSKTYKTFYGFVHGLAGNGVKVLLLVFPSLAKYFIASSQLQGKTDEQPKS
jgi:hypothetical protein